MAIFTKPKFLFLFFLILSIFLASQCDEEENNPYLFKYERFRSRFRSKHGEFRVLEKFTEKSELLGGLDRYGVAVLEFEPLSFMLPHHCDAEVILLAARGRGRISIAEQDEKNSFNLENGDVMRVNAGSTIYMLNRDNNERFFVCVLAKTVNIPGKFQEYFSGGGENPESFYRAFSSEILETAFNVNPKGHNSAPIWTTKKGNTCQSHGRTNYSNKRTRFKLNLLNERPLLGNRFGHYFEATPERFEQLRDLDAAAGIMHINQGGMLLPVYCTRTTWFVTVVEGNGRFEMACPHLGSQSQSQRQGRHYQRVQGSLSVGDVMIIRTGHPITVIATGDSDLRMVGIGFNAHNNRVNFLAGRQSIWRNIDREAKEVSFNMAAREVEEILQKQDQSYFVAGPEQRQ